MKEYVHICKGVDPVADAFSGTATSDVVNMSRHALALGIISKGVGASGTSVVTVDACDDVTPTNTTAIKFYYQTVTSTDVHSALTLAATTGFTTTAGSSQRYLIYVPASHLAASGYQYLRVVCTESVNSAVMGSIDILLLEPQYGEETQPTRLT